STKEDFKNCTVSNREDTTTGPTNQKESNIVERKENPYTSTKANENKTSSNLVLPRHLHAGTNFEQTRKTENQK
ncbi:11624_t:CDS:2, partial [Dentiscutata erythropus]